MVARAFLEDHFLDYAVVLGGWEPNPQVFMIFWFLDMAQALQHKYMGLVLSPSVAEITIQKFEVGMIF